MTSPKNENRRSTLFWMLLPALLLGTSVAGWIVMISMAVDDPSFSVEPDYYKKASRYDEVIERRAHNARLGLELEVTSFEWDDSERAVLTMTLVDREGAPAPGYDVTASAFSVARGNDVRDLSFVETTPGVYQAMIAAPRTGLWELRMNAVSGSRVFTQKVRTELMAGVSDPS